MSERVQFPTKAQIAAIDDVDALTGIREEAAQRVLQIEAQLEFRSDDEAWETRAVNALAGYRYLERLAHRRIEALKKSGAGAPVRDRADCDPLTLELLDGWTVDAEAMATAEAAEAALAALRARVSALHGDRGDEVDRPCDERDSYWLQKAKAALKSAGLLAGSLASRIATLHRAEKAARHQATMDHDGRRERAFIDAARDLLDPETFRAIWAAVDRRRLEVGRVVPADAERRERLHG